MPKSPTQVNEESINNSIRETIRSALQQIGYSDEMLVPDVRFVGEHDKSYQADMVAYSSSLRHDTDTAVISVKGTEDTEKVQYDSEVSPFRALATPVVVLAEYRTVHGDEPRVRTVGLSKDASAFNQQKENIVPLSRFHEYLKEHQEQFTPRRLEMAKMVPIQLTLFDVAPDLIDEPFKIVGNDLIERFQQGVKIILKDTTREQKRGVINASLAFLGARILRDRLKKDWPLTHGAAEFLNQAGQFLPDYFKVPVGIAQRLDPLLDRLHSVFNFSQVNLDMVGEFYSSVFVNKEIRDKWGIHYTKSLLAKTLLDRMPIEEIPPDKRILGDPTCGSGSLLIAGYERLARATYLRIPPDERHNRLVKSIFGNDLDEVAAQIARMTLMLFHPPHLNNWKVTHLDAEDDDFGDKWIKKIGDKIPTIIVANPPFGGEGGSGSNTRVPRTRNQADRSALILNHCLDILPDGGLLGIILTATVLDQQGVKETRHRVLKEGQILDQWDIPPEWFKDVNRPLLAWIIRKSAPTSKTVHFFPLSDVPAPGRAAQLEGAMHIEVNTPPRTLVPSTFDDLLKKMERSPSCCLANYYLIFNGLQTLPGKVAAKKSPNAHPWSGKKLVGTNPYSDFSDGHMGWLELVDSNFKRSRRELRKHLAQNEPLVMLRANRNIPLVKYRWSSIALLDVPKGSRRVVAPQENFQVTFSKKTDRIDQENYIYALWAILNHPLASLWFHELFRMPKITIDSYSNFPLPGDWDVDKVQSLASMAKELIEAQRARLKPPLQESPEMKKMPGIKDIMAKVEHVDDIIYHMYGISSEEMHRVEEWFDKGEPRPGLKEYGKHSKGNGTEVKPDLSIIYEEPAWETTCETLEICLKDQQIRLAIDGLRDCHEGLKPAEEGIWLKVLPVMPGWLLEKGAIAWIELTTGSAARLRESPEKYIVRFHLHKNAYKSQDEIDQSLFSIPELKSKKAEMDG